MKKKGTVPSEKMTRGDSHESTSVQFDELEYKSLRLLIRDAEVIAAEARAAMAQAVAARDAYLATLAAKYGFEATAIRSMQWNDETHEFRFIR